MKSFILLVTFITVASAAKKYSKPLNEHFEHFLNEPTINLIIDEDERPPSSFSGNVMQAQITSLSSQNHGKGKFNYNFETQNEINIASIGKLKDEKTFVVSGSYSYTGGDGKRYRVRYTADEFGYHPVTELEENEPVQVVIQPKAERTGKLLFNRDFVPAAPVAQEPSRLYLPTNEYLPPQSQPQPQPQPQPQYQPQPQCQPQPQQYQPQPQPQPLPLVLSRSEPIYQPIPAVLPSPPPLPALPQ